MPIERPRILITNDDGYHSEGILALESALKEIGDVFVVAPASEMSGASHSLTLSRPLRIRQIDERHWTVDGTPTDCVTLAVNMILTPRQLPDICASGINHGPNLGDDATYSGTVAGALESTILGVPGLAFSLVASRDCDFSESARIARTITERALAEGLPPNTLLNVNIPKGIPKGVRITKQGFKNARPIITEHIDPRGKPYYWIGELREGFHAEGGTDFEAIDEGYVSVTPMRSDLTNHQAIERLQNWDSEL
ncbi:MAG: 5'/3'-nucleotidase SurE [Acidobacteria bacterium]|nr:5'/3'-nucleotidase SurE [Acidobacteriota bacterium]MBK8150480.1 5'/3'-nucleotidase SurE [Acidobacteriota bacterium]MBK8809351.1 5'/3'-nucleotidase SurE [Acidobacteriota bacterium]